MTDKPKRIFLVAAEASGDKLGARLIRALRQTDPDIEMAGVGGPRMAEEGIISPFDISDLSVLGLLEGVKILKLVKQRARETAQAAKAFDADAVILVDSWGFMVRVAWACRDLDPDMTLIKYVGPQVFATRPGRAKTLARSVDHLLGIHPFDRDYFEPAGLPTQFVGNPALENLDPGDKIAFRTRHGLRQDQPLLVTLFGSRKSEIERLYKPFADTLRSVKSRHPDLAIISVLAQSQAEILKSQISNEVGLEELILVDENERADAFQAANLALACSGTVTLELAAYGVPTVTAYKLGWITWAIARAFLMKSRYISLVNISADAPLIDEFVQTRARPDLLVQALATYLDNPDKQEKTSLALLQETTKMRGQDEAPSQKAARALIEILNAP